MRSTQLKHFDQALYQITTPFYACWDPPGSLSSNRRFIKSTQIISIPRLLNKVGAQGLEDKEINLEKQLHEDIQTSPNQLALGREVWMLMVPGNFQSACF